ncbi:MAG: TonB-dependent receptor [Acidobacteriota bacterium]
MTARKREEDPQTIPLSLTAFSDVALEERSLADLSDIGEVAPNVSFTLSGGFADGTSEASVFIRGVGQGDTALFSDPGVGIYVDGVFLARAQGAVVDLLDLERVEVLRGPQGTLFGKNTTGGAISLITRRPGDQRGGRLSTTVGDYDRIDLQGSFDIPLGGDLYGSAAVLGTRRDGFSTSAATGQEFHDDDRTLGRFAVDWAPEGSASVRVTVDAMRENEVGGNTLILGIRSTPVLDFYNQARLGAGLEPFDDRWISGDLRTSFATHPSFLDGETWGTSVDATWAGDDRFLKSITAYRAFDYSASSDGDGSPLTVAERDLEQEHYQLSQEVQLSGSGDRADWLVGALFFREKPREQNTQRVLGDLFTALELSPGPIYAPPGVPSFLCNPGPTPPGLPCFGGAGNPLNLGFFVGDGEVFHSDLENESWALFGESTWALRDDLSLTGGLRFTRDEKRFDYLNIGAFGQVVNDLRNEDSWEDWSGRVSLAWQVRPEVLLYGTVSRGFKSGGFNGRPQGRDQLDPFDPETVLSYELGWKGDFLDRRLRVNGSAFASDYEDIHFAASLDVGGVPVFVTQNAGAADIRGFEVELEAHPATGLVLTASLGHLDTELVELDPRIPAGITLANDLPRSPEWSWSASIQYAFILANRGTLIARADYAHQDGFFFDIANTPEVAQPSYGLLGARVVYTPSAGDFDLALFGTNLSDEEYLETGFDTGAFGLGLGLGGRPREWGLEATYRF